LRDIHEYVIVASKGSYARVRKGKDTITKKEFLEATVSIWNILPESARRVGHPAPFPVELPGRLIELYTFEGDLVLDPFLGSGTTAVAAVESNRHYIGYELDAEYIDIAERRIKEGRTGKRSVHI
jgi:site-specific DNA-methyltransferase (adenine-specific)